MIQYNTQESKLFDNFRYGGVIDSTGICCLRMQVPVGQAG